MQNTINFQQRITRVARQVVKRMLSKNVSFQPYSKPLNIKGIEAKFFFGTEQAQEWYDPLKSYAKLEYEWVLQNIPLKNQKIIDAGAHHGQYSVVFCLGAMNTCTLVSVDPNPMNCLLTEINLLRNEAKAHIEQCAVAASSGVVHFAEESNGRIIQHGGLLVKAKTLLQILPDANIVKLDVEGAEYEIVPEAIDKLTKVHTWIIEFHPQGNPHPDTIIKEFLQLDYKVAYINRDTNRVEPYKLATIWNIHSTIFACKN